MEDCTITKEAIIVHQEGKRTGKSSFSMTTSFCVIRDLKQTDAAAANLQISVQRDSRPSEFTRPLTSVTLNLNEDLPVDRHHVSLLKFSIDETRFQSNRQMKLNASTLDQKCSHLAKVPRS